MWFAKALENNKIKKEKNRNFFIQLFKAFIRPKNTEKRCLLQGIVLNGFISIAKAHC